MNKTKTYLVSKIVYDYGSEWSGFSKPKLPKKLIIEQVPNDIEDIEDFIASEVSNLTGFCIESFLFEQTNNQK